MTDTEALDRIARVLDAESWSPDTLDDIAVIVRQTGREVKDVDLPVAEDDSPEVNVFGHANGHSPVTYTGNA